MPPQTPPLFIFEMANNHMGSVDLGCRIIREFAAVARDFPFRFAFKLQYRHLPTFIHPDFQARMDLKFVKRFSETRLSEEEFLVLLQEIKKNNFLSMCTPFDEASVERIEKHGFDFIKIGSCSFMDWPLLERIAAAPLPVFASAGGAGANEIDRVVSFFLNRRKSLSLLHCVADYPTPSEKMNLNQISWMRNRYPSLPIGISSHENPEDTDVVLGAVGHGATIFERHVGLPTPQHPLNAYSMTPVQCRAWLTKAAKGFLLQGLALERVTGGKEEEEQLRGLSRAVFAKTDLKAGESVDSTKYFLAMPSSPGQLLARDLSKYCEIITKQPILRGQAVFHASVILTDYQETIRKILSEVKNLLRLGGVTLPKVQSDLEISHHYGIENFRKVGAVLVNFVNREYCKKILTMLPGQSHPEHLHRKKEETFYIVWGEMQVNLDGAERHCIPGDMVLIQQESATPCPPSREWSLRRYPRTIPPTIPFTPTRRSPVIYGVKPCCHTGWIKRRGFSEAS